ncbi:MAG: Gfo/Idh/MocA family oxidoreductase [Candidatus Paceibacterota bacterium]|jgi:hypothetical protein
MEKLLIVGKGSYGSYVADTLEGDYAFAAEPFIGANDFKENFAYVATPHDTHFDIASKLLALGKHVLCDKPLCLFLKEVSQLYKMADEKNLHLGVGFLLHHHPFYVWLKSMRQKFGGIQSVSVLNNATEGRIATDWYWDKKRSGGWFFISEIHWYHLFAWLTDADDASVVFASETKEGGKTTSTKSEIRTDKGEMLRVSHDLNSKDEDVKCTVTIEFANITVTVFDWVPFSLSLSDHLFVPNFGSDFDIEGGIVKEKRDRDVIYQSLIKNNIDNLFNQVPDDRESIILAHRLAQEADQKSDDQ